MTDGCFLLPHHPLRHAELSISTAAKYGCEAYRTNIPAEDLEAIFAEQLKSFLVSPAEVDAYLGRAHDTLTEKERLLENRKKEADKIRQDKDRTHRLYLDDEISAEAFGKFFQPIGGRQIEQEEEPPRPQAQIDSARILVPSPCPNPSVPN